MKVYLSKYRSHWISPYTILEKVCFWEKDKDVFYNLEDHPNHKYEKAVIFLHGICHRIEKVWDFIHPPIRYVKIDKYDTWNMDSTLAEIILPMLKQLKATKHGSQVVDMEDVPEELRCTTHEEWDDQKCFEFYHEHKAKENDCDIHARWDWVMGEMIYAFESFTNDWEQKYHSGNHDYKSVPCEWDENGKPTMFTFEKGPKHTAEFDVEGYQKESDRINNGFKLFGKYFRGLWD